MRVKGLLGPDHIEGVKSGKIDRATRMTVESVSTSEAQLEGSNRWYSIVVRGASGKDIRQLFERQGALVSRVLRVSVGTLKLDKSAVARPAPAVDRCGDRHCSVARWTRTPKTEGLAASALRGEPLSRDAEARGT